MGDGIESACGETVNQQHLKQKSLKCYCFEQYWSNDFLCSWNLIDIYVLMIIDFKQSHLQFNCPATTTCIAY